MFRSKLVSLTHGSFSVKDKLAGQLNWNGATESKKTATSKLRRTSDWFYIYFETVIKEIV